jgi:hypothetical protein
MGVMVSAMAFPASKQPHKIQPIEIMFPLFIFAPHPLLLFFANLAAEFHRSTFQVITNEKNSQQALHGKRLALRSHGRVQL